jgi:hypothetical protein
MQQKPTSPSHDARDGDEHLGAVEGERATDPQPGNTNAPGINAEGLPNDPIATCEDALGANVDESEGG